MLEFGSVELLATVLVVHFEELVLADDDNIWVLFVVVFHRVIIRLRRNATRVEHPLVAGHGHGKLPRILWFQGLFVNLLLEFEYSGGPGGSPLRRIASSSVIAVRVEVRDIRNDGIAISKVCGLIPPIVYPVLHVGVLTPGHQSHLKCLASTARLDKVLDRPLSVFEFRFAKKGAYRLQVLLRRLLEGGNRESR